MITLRNIFRQLVHPSIEGGGGGGSVRLSIDGVSPAPITPEPDEAELAVEAFLQTLSPLSRKGESRVKARNEASKPPSLTGGVRGGSYYRQLAEKIKAAHAEEARAATRYVAYCENTLSPLPHQGESRAKAREAGAVEGSAGANNTSEERLSPSTGEREEGLRSLERGLFKHQDTVEREGGDLLRRWQHCLADVTIRLMTETTSNSV